jgi:hypothetical protein
MRRAEGASRRVLAGGRLIFRAETRISTGVGTSAPENEGIGIESEFVSALIGLVAGSAAAAIKAGVALRAKVGEELRGERLAAYPALWKLTGTFSVWPRGQRTYEELERFHLALRRWYYADGGIYFSERSRDRYGDVQELAAVHLASAAGREGDGKLSPEIYADLERTCKRAADRFGR